MVCVTPSDPFTLSFGRKWNVSVNLPVLFPLSTTCMSWTQESCCAWKIYMILCVRIKRIHVYLSTTRFAGYAHTDRDTLETFPLFLPQPALTVGSLEVLCPSSPCPWELCLRAGTGGVPRSTMCASHSGSRCTPLPLHGSGELPSSEGLSVRVGERTCYHRTPPNISLPFPVTVDPGYESLSWIGWRQWDAWEDAVMDNQTNCNKQCEVVCKWLRSVFSHILLLQRLNHRVDYVMPTRWSQQKRMWYCMKY